MTTIQKQFNQVCTKKYVPLGFFRKKTTYIRLSGNVLQSFSLKHFKGRPYCSVDFGVTPLCLPQPFFLDVGPYSLNKFNVPISEWPYDAKSAESILQCVESVSETIDLHMLPFFEMCCDCRSALPELIKLEELFDRNRIETLRLLGGYDSAAPLEERSLCDYRKYYMALKANDFSYARRYLEFQIDLHKKSLKEFDNPNYPKQPPSVKEGFLRKLHLHTSHLEHLNSGDVRFFSDMLAANEQETYRFLATNYPKILKAKDRPISWQ
ncbi:MAG: hypothetical protein E7453_08370 [Ruminococcaceae bacterium]|nr:hypothetical protein [Oscillospiraceae bacterium]